MTPSDKPPPFTAADLVFEPLSNSYLSGPWMELTLAESSRRIRATVEALDAERALGKRARNDALEEAARLMDERVTGWGASIRGLKSLGPTLEGPRGEVLVRALRDERDAALARVKELEEALWLECEYARERGLSVLPTTASALSTPKVKP